MAKKKPNGGHESRESPQKEAKEEGRARRGDKAAGLPGGLPPQAPGQRVKNPKVL